MYVQLTLTSFQMGGEKLAFGGLVREKQSIPGLSPFAGIPYSAKFSRVVNSANLANFPSVLFAKMFNENI